MPTASPPLIALPQPEVPLVDPQTGKLTKDGYDFMKRLEQVVKKIRTEIP
jgi:hypothetical protein